MQFIALAAVLLMALSIRVVAGTWFHPSAVSAVAWGLFLAIPIYLGLAPVPWTAFAVAMITLGALLAAAMRVEPDEVRPLMISCRPLLRKFVLLGAVAGGGAGYLALSANGISPTDSLSLAAINVAAREATIMRYAGDMATPIAAVLMLGFTYGAALAAPYAAATSQGWRKVALLVAPSVGGALYAVATTARAGFLISGMLTVGAWIVTVAVTQGGRPRVPARAVLGTTTAAAAGAFVFLYAAVTRIGGWGHDTTQILSRKVAVYAGGGIPAFEGWLNDPDRPVEHGLGAHTVSGVSQFVTGDPELGSAYEEWTEIGQGLATNVYTILRPLTADFSFAGAVAILCICSAAAAWAYRRAVVGASVTAAVLVSAWLGVVLFSSTASVLMFTNVVLGLALGGWMVHRTVQFKLLPSGTADD